MDYKSIRKQLGFTQTEVAILVGVSLTSYQNWERGVTKPSQENKKRLHKVLKIK